MEETRWYRFQRFMRGITCAIAGHPLLFKTGNEERPWGCNYCDGRWSFKPRRSV